MPLWAELSLPAPRLVHEENTCVSRIQANQPAEEAKRRGGEMRRRDAPPGGRKSWLLKWLTEVRLANSPAGEYRYTKLPPQLDRSGPPEAQRGAVYDTGNDPVISLRGTRATSVNRNSSWDPEHQRKSICKVGIADDPSPLARPCRMSKWSILLSVVPCPIPISFPAFCSWCEKSNQIC